MVVVVVAVVVGVVVVVVVVDFILISVETVCCSLPCPSTIKQVV